MVPSHHQTKIVWKFHPFPMGRTFTSWEILSQSAEICTGAGSIWLWQKWSYRPSGKAHRGTSLASPADPCNPRKWEIPHPINFGWLIEILIVLSYIIIPITKESPTLVYRPWNYRLAPENWRLVEMYFLLEDIVPFSGFQTVSFREGITWVWPPSTCNSDLFRLLLRF